MTDEHKIGPNKVATVHYTGTLPETDEVFDSSEGAEPMSFIVGTGQMIPGFESELLGAAPGDKREFTLQPKQAYGDYSDEQVVVFSKEVFGEDVEIEVGAMMHATLENGDEAAFIITAINEDGVTADFNHPLSGKNLHFSVTVVEVREATPEELDHGHVH